VRSRKQGKAIRQATVAATNPPTNMPSHGETVARRSSSVDV